MTFSASKTTTQEKVTASFEQDEEIDYNTYLPSEQGTGQSPC